VRLLDLATGKEQWQKKLPAEVVSLAFAPKEAWLACTVRENSILVLDTSRSGDVRWKNVPTTPKPGSFSGLAFSPNGQLLCGGWADGKLTAWNAATGKELWSLSGPASTVTSVAFSPDSQKVVAVRTDGTVQLCEAGTGKQFFALHGSKASGITSVAFQPDGNAFAVGADDGSVRLWDLQGREKKVVPLHTGAVTSLAFLSDGRRIASGGADKQVLVWEVETGKVGTRLSGHTDRVNSVAVGAKSILSGSSDRTMRLWELP
jgi:WD40 repeat protein